MKLNVGARVRLKLTGTVNESTHAIATVDWDDGGTSSEHTHHLQPIPPEPAAADAPDDVAEALCLLASEHRAMLIVPGRLVVLSGNLHRGVGQFVVALRRPPSFSETVDPSEPVRFPKVMLETAPLRHGRILGAEATVVAPNAPAATRALLEESLVVLRDTGRDFFDDAVARHLVSYRLTKRLWGAERGA